MSNQCHAANNGLDMHIKAGPERFAAFAVLLIGFVACLMDSHMFEAAQDSHIPVYPHSSWVTVSQGHPFHRNLQDADYDRLATSVSLIIHPVGGLGDKNEGM
ncbi:hypothetical protein AYO22_10829 [Fonsecaea multimorphosa]|nr:hypothetical protein AYO22_10829 [Fonsecaea multimorphosa]